MRMFALLFCVLAGCNAVDSSADDESSIQGGHVDSGDPAVGLVWLAGGGFCSGSLIAPNVVLTAGHCVADPIEAFYTGEGKKTASVGAEPTSGLAAHGVSDQVAHPSYSPYGGCPNQTFDVGLVRLSKPIKGVKPLTRATAAPPYSSACRIVGYGVHSTSDGEYTVEQRRGANVWVKGVGQTWIDLLWKTGIADHGDSGGPLLCDEKVAAVTSCGVDGSYPDHREAYYARTDDINKWIDSTVKSWSKAAE